MFGLLNQPYPLDDSSVRQLRKAALIGLFVGLFLLVFQPFGLNSWETSSKAIKILGFGLVTFVITSVNFVLLPRVTPRLFAEERWTVGREITLVMANILLIALANRLYLAWLLDSKEVSSISWGGMILVTFLVGFFPVVGLVLLSYITQLKKYSNAAATIPIHAQGADSVPPAEVPTAPSAQLAGKTVTLIADNEKDTLTVMSDDLLYIESSDNYCTIVHLKNAQAVKPLLRSSLSRLEKQIGNPHIVRCHRSYVVNLDRVERITGNAQGYKLHLGGGQSVVPVARQYNETIIAELKAL
ncbi:LytR/AlgR family response regulator transcription factor [Spirosoma radiotolerans]|uniref:Histidine kinase n=1 Tax=Spirosoma radiotolerans TaxID=1379870 RepID=A0A0E4A054_9BACT|nr:LytTR family DNA-binding domain-containing protein [Spirosoma radiotolerans]AKD57740.1 histidine kinase [Spirosoma radiotolerans]